ncbi:type II toxin-antitoxin system PemK/MazF family toxin [Nonomuraea endophytica]|uniref:mRNA interferase MazF n=1 Tax=Nonomuraea endophytica TaxID=714136 RepID=A0A7W8EJ73_9ACTN|nr:type II toxin-antitoxin system PemK/MazF family toxin [Nonomuraea endophytica]MBB5082840.1 mRNA interferase MazF [Nonomuraea endophytica]
MVIRGAVYRVDLGEAKRGHEQRGKRYGLVVSPSDMAWSVVTVIPTSTSAQPSLYRPEIDLLGTPTRFLVDQIRTIDTDYIRGEAVYYLGGDELAAVESALTRYLEL